MAALIPAQHPGSEAGQDADARPSVWPGKISIGWRLVVANEIAAGYLMNYASTTHRVSGVSCNYIQLQKYHLEQHNIYIWIITKY